MLLLCDLSFFFYRDEKHQKNIYICFVKHYDFILKIVA